MKDWLLIGLYVSGFSVAAFGVYAAMGGPTNIGCSERRAYEAIKEKVSENLVSPTSAVFPDWSDVAQKKDIGCGFNVSGYLDSQNALGVMIRTKYIGQTFKTADGYIAVASITD